MHSTTLKHAMPIVATALGRRFGVQVRVGGDQAATDGQTIWLPDLPADSRLRPVAWGLLAHEASHVRHTDMAIFQAVARESPLRRHLLNLLEDIRIELAIRRDYPGTESSLARVIEWMLAEGHLDPPDPSDHPARILTASLLLILRHRVLGQQALTQAAQESERVLRQTLPAARVHRLLGLPTEVRGLGSTAEAASLAERIQQLLEPDRTASQPEAAERPASSDPEAGAANTETEAGECPAHPSPDQASGEVGDGASDTEARASSQTEAEADPEGPAANAGSIAADANHSDSDDLLQRVIGAGEGDLGDDLFASVRQVLATESGAGGARPSRLPIPEDPPCHRPFGEDLLRQVDGTSRVLVARLLGLVQSSRMDRPHAVCRGRRLVPARLHRAGVGDARLFVRRRSRIAPNTAFHLLVDLSGSMNNPTPSGQRAFRVALESALAVALALERIPGVTVAVSAFPGLGGDTGRITRLVQHGQSVRQRAGAFQQGPRGGTPLAQALWFAAADLTLRSEPRRLILVMTDGVPNDWATAVEILGLCEAGGIEPVGIGIGCDVSTLFSVGTRVEEAGALKQTLFGLAERLLV
ncbi:von Willebrand factor type A [Thiorhodococcus drewsii AZ1]|uniref:von Willebrand factor type A n=1 Tax=Thiorhodococcus drewsii AZ1 TaxID=765913 RepID=G2E6X5_9GAMM|nr:VWA domain-containing protein [Thiorhodococcus drewsii]EGV28137.1 von Willebrand factor type A [Thiorhodococcus drewsii AZ1]